MPDGGDELAFKDDNGSGVGSDFFHAIGQRTGAPMISKVAVDGFNLKT